MFRGRVLTGALISGALAVGGGALAGCGSSDGGDNGDSGGTANLSVLQRAAATTGKQQSFHLSSDVDQTLAGKKVTIHSEGDHSGRRSYLHFDFAPLVQSLGGAAALGGALEKVGGTAALKADIVSDGSTMLLRMPALQRGLKTFAHRDEPAWASIDLAKFGRVVGVDFRSLIANSTGPEQALGYLRSLSGTLTTVGDTTIDGVKTTHYRGTIDFGRLPSGGTLTPAQRKSMAQVAKLLKQSGATTKIPLDVWVDGENLLRREVISQSVAGERSVTTLNLSDYGKTVDIPVPPATERYDALALVEQLAPGALSKVGKQLQGGGLTP
jgi:hypothetical protein